MFQPQVVGDVEQLVSSDPAACDSSGLACLVAVSQRVRGWLDAYDARIALRAGQLRSAGRGACAAEVLAGEGRRSARDAAAAARRAGVCDQLPAVHDALAAGEVSAGHVDAIGRAAAALGDAGRSRLVELQPAIVAAAASASVEDFAKDMGRLQQLLSCDDGSEQERNRRNRKVRRWVDQATGMCHTHLQLDAETDARVAAALDAAVAAARAKRQDRDVTFDQLQADALVELITRPSDAVTGDGGRRVPEVTVLIDLDTLRHGLHHHGVCETGDGNPIPAASVRRMCCDAAIIPVVLDGAGVAVDVGRVNRLATVDQRRALRAMHSTCVHPGCAMRFEDCRIHHVVPWEHHGDTDVDNLVPLCSSHHHLVHEGGWTLTLRPDRTTTLRRPDGTIHNEGSTVSRAPHGVAGDRPAPIAAEPASNSPPPAQPWRPNPACTEMPAHLIRSALRLHGGADDEARHQAQRRDIAAAVNRRCTSVGIGEPADANPAPLTRPPPVAPAA